MTNYPLGVTGNEYAIAGPDYDKESDELCGHMIPVTANGMNHERECDEPTMEQGYGGNRWLVCDAGHVTDLPEHEYDGPDTLEDKRGLR